MTRRTIVVSISLAAALGLVSASLMYRYRERIPASWQTPVRALLGGISIRHDIRIRAHDGTHLASSLYMPRGEQDKLATIYIALPYDRREYGEAVGAALFFARHGYAVLVQDVRGTFESEGEFLPWRHATGDGASTLDWIAAQPWSNGKVGTFGCSALGELQYALARARHPAHAAMIPIGAGGAVGSARGSYEYFGVYEGGVFQLASGFGWFSKHGTRRPDPSPLPDHDTQATLRQLPINALVRNLRPAPNAYTDYLETPLGSPRWDERDFISDRDRPETPALIINTWGDQTLAGTLALAEQSRAVSPANQRARQHVIIAPGDHCAHEDAGNSGRFGELKVRNATLPYYDWYLRWFDYWLRGTGDGLAELPPYLYYVIGENRWRHAATWPPADARVQHWYLDSAGHANSRDGDGALRLQVPRDAAFDAYRYDPLDPVPTRGGPICCSGDSAIRPGPADQRDVEARDDVLVYTSQPLDRPLRIVGPLRARLTVSSSAPDTDFVARLVHVWPDGRATNIQEGVLRARYRHGIAAPELMQANRRYPLTVEMRSIAYLVPKGHRIRLDIASSSFPRLERNLNTGGRNFDESRPATARNRVHHGGQSLSYLELPVLD